MASNLQITSYGLLPGILIIIPIFHILWCLLQRVYKQTNSIKITRKIKSMLKLYGAVQNYAWGKIGNHSIIANFQESSSAKCFVTEQDKPYAELWMGTHPSGPAILSDSGVSLLEWLRNNPQAVGAVPSGYAAHDLAFLFKVLSVNTALSIQAHPDKTLAHHLHATNPAAYKDANHKPEMTIALSQFECLCGFRTTGEIRANLQEFPELEDLLVQSGVDTTVLGAPGTDSVIQLRALFGAYLTCPDDLAGLQLHVLTSRLRAKTNLSRLEQLVLRLSGEYPGDRGVFAAVLLNFLTLEPGQSFFIGANEPHAYLRGDCVECMALSDNVVRAGLTPKFKDVDTLCAMLSYRSGEPEMLTPIPLDAFTSVYRPPFESCAEFEVETTTVPPCTASYQLIVGNYASIFLVVEGRATSATSEGSIDLRKGSVVFIAANTSVSVSTTDEKIVFYRAHINLTSII